MSSISSATVRCLEGNGTQNAEEQAGRTRQTRLPAPPASPTSACWPPASSSNSGSSHEKLGRRSAGQSMPISLSCKRPKGLCYAPRAGVVRYDHVAFACAVLPASNLCAVLQHASRQAPHGLQGAGQGRAGRACVASRDVEVQAHHVLGLRGVQQASRRCAHDEAWQQSASLRAARTRDRRREASDVLAAYQTRRAPCPHRWRSSVRGAAPPPARKKRCPVACRAPGAAPEPKQPAATRDTDAATEEEGWGWIGHGTNLRNL